MSFQELINRKATRTIWQQCTCTCLPAASLPCHSPLDYSALSGNSDTR